MAKPMGTLFVEADLDLTKAEQKLQALHGRMVAGATKSEEAFKSLGVSSDRMFAAQKATAIAAYQAIRNNANSTAADIVRAERAKNAKIKALQDGLVGHHKMSMAAMTRAILRFYAAYYVISNVIRVVSNTIMSGIKAIDELKISTIAVAAQLTSMQGPENVTENFRKNVVYADALNRKLMEIDASSFANYEQINLMNRSMVQQGVLLDINNAKQVEAFSALTNAVAMLTVGQNKNKQASQEARALFSGQARVTDQVALSLDALIKKQGIYKGGLKELVKEGKKHGDTLERFAPYLIGITAATADIEKTWEAVSASIQTAWGIVQRAVFRDVYKDLTEAGRDAATYMRKNADEIAENILRVAKVFKDAGSGIGSSFQVIAAGALQAYSAVLNIAKAFAYLRSKVGIGKEYRAEYKAIFEELKIKAKAASDAANELARRSQEPFLRTPKTRTKTKEGAIIIPFIPPTAEYGEALDKIKSETLKTQNEIADFGLSTHAATMQQIEREKKARLDVMAVERQGYKDSLTGYLAGQVSRGEMTVGGAGKFKTEKMVGFDKGAQDRMVAIREATNAKILLADMKLYEKQAEEGRKASDKAVELMMKEIDAGVKLGEERLKILADFNTQYNELGKSQYEIERTQIEDKYKTYIDAAQNNANKIVEIDNWKTAKLKKNAQEENLFKIGQYGEAAGRIADTFKEISEAGGRQSKKAFEMYKTFAIIEATISAHKAIVGALGSPPYGLGAIVLASAIGAQAFMQVAMISASKAPSYDQGGISNAKGVYQTGNISEAHIPLKGGKVPVNVNGGGGGTSIIIKMENPVFQDVDTQRQVFAQIAEVIATRVAPGAVVQNYNDDGAVRQMVRNRA